MRKAYPICECGRRLVRWTGRPPCWTCRACEPDGPFPADGPAWEPEPGPGVILVRVHRRRRWRARRRAA